MKILLTTVPVRPISKGKSQDTYRTKKNLMDGENPVLPKIAIVSLVKWMEKHGYSSDMYDYYDIDMMCTSDEEFIEYLKEYQPTIVGLSAVVSTSYSQVKRLSRIIRDTCPDAWIVCGGAITAVANTLLRRTNVDLCVIGDGEIPWVEFLDYVKENDTKFDIEKIKAIKGLTFIFDDELHFTGHGKKAPPEDFQYPDYDLLKSGMKLHPDGFNNYFSKGIKTLWFNSDERAYESHRRPMIANLWTTKGCVAKCTFCQRTIKGYRIGDITTLDEHLEELKEKYNVGFISIADENFGSNRKHAYSVAETMKRNDMLWSAGGIRCTSVTREDIEFFKKNNCSSFKFGTESGSQKILDIMEKKFTVEDIFKAQSETAEFEIYSPLAVMAGMPGETLETAMETGKFLGTLAHIQGNNPRYVVNEIFYALPLPGTPLYEHGQQLGLIGTSPEEEEEYLLNVSGSGTGKLNYLNLNGSPMKEVLFWDYLMKLEASRTFREIIKTQPMKETFLAKVWREQGKKLLKKPSMKSKILKVIETGNLNHVFSAESTTFRFFSTFLEVHLINNKYIDALPRWFIYPIIQNLLYFEFLVQSLALKIFSRRYNLYANLRPKNYLPEDFLNADRTKDRSLRSLVAAHRLDPNNETEKNRQTLVRGL